MRTNREANRLPNGNSLFTSQNRVIEVAPNGDIVWQMHDPEHGDNRKNFHKAIRVGLDGKVYGG